MTLSRDQAHSRVGVVDNRNEVRDFLASRRAQLAGVSIEYYIRFGNVP